jgi:hypothetical protein
MEAAGKTQAQLNEETCVGHHDCVVHTIHLLPTIESLCNVIIIPWLPDFDEHLVNNFDTTWKMKIQTRQILQLNLIGPRYLMSKCISDTQSNGISHCHTKTNMRYCTGQDL